VLQVLDVLAQLALVLPQLGAVVMKRLLVMAQLTPVVPVVVMPVVIVIVAVVPKLVRQARADGTLGHCRCSLGRVVRRNAHSTLGLIPERPL
jgi:hypothetical protein